MADGRTLRGRSIIVAGAGFAGLTAAVELHHDGAEVTVIEARDRVGGRAWTICGGVLFAGEHTGFKWQGYMNRAVESGLRAAAEVRRMVLGSTERRQTTFVETAR